MGGSWLKWEELTDLEKEMATEQYRYIRECEECEPYSYEMAQEGVVCCTFERIESEDGTHMIFVNI